MFALLTVNSLWFWQDWTSLFIHVRFECIDILTNVGGRVSISFVRTFLLISLSSNCSIFISNLVERELIWSTIVVVVDNKFSSCVFMIDTVCGNFLHAQQTHAPTLSISLICTHVAWNQSLHRSHRMESEAESPERVSVHCITFWSSISFLFLRCFGLFCFALVVFVSVFSFCCDWHTLLTTVMLSSLLSSLSASSPYVASICDSVTVEFNVSLGLLVCCPVLEKLSLKVQPRYVLTLHYLLFLFPIENI